MQINRPRSMTSIYPHSRSMATGYYERLQKVIDATKTAVQSLELRKKFIERQNLMNYRNEYDRLAGEMSHLKPDLQKQAMQNMMEERKLRALGEFIEPEPVKEIDTPEIKNVYRRQRQARRDRETIRQAQLAHTLEQTEQRQVRAKSKAKAKAKSGAASSSGR